MMLSNGAIQKLKKIQVSAAEVEKLNEDYSKSGIFNFFQLRPKERTIELVSFLPRYPMRGIELTFKKSRGKLDAISKRMKELGGEPPQAADMAGWGFRERSKQTITYREDDVQAAFCLRQLKLDAQFDGIKFVAAEFLIAAENKRIDVLGVKDTTLYIFELKKDRKTDAYNQADQYKRELEANLNTYLELLRYYPNINKNMTTATVRAVAVMPWAEKHQLAKPGDVAHWLYDVPPGYDFSGGLTFHKSE
jgi:hypothetical protein